MPNEKIRALEEALKAARTEAGEPEPLTEAEIAAMPAEEFNARFRELVAMGAAGQIEVER